MVGALGRGASRVRGLLTEAWCPGSWCFVQACSGLAWGAFSEGRSRPGCQLAIDWEQEGRAGRKLWRGVDFLGPLDHV